MRRHYAKHMHRNWRHARKKSKTSRNFKNKVKRIISQQDESKFLDTTLAADTAPISGTSVIAGLILIGTGDTVNNREGNSIKLTSIELKYLVQNDATANDIDTTCRIIIFRAKKNIQGVLPIVTELLSTDVITSLRSTTGASDITDFKVYMDKTFVLERKTTSTQQVTRTGKFYKSLGGLKCTFDGNASGIATAEEGHLFLLRMTTKGATFQPLWSLNIRVRFKEL